MSNLEPTHVAPGGIDRKREARNDLRNRRYLQKVIAAHGGTGQRSNLDRLEACRLGVCMICSGKWGPLFRHIPKHYPKLSAEAALREFRTEFNIPDDVPLVADWHRELLSRGHTARMQGPHGELTKANLAEKSSHPNPEGSGKTGVNPSENPLSNWAVAKYLVRGIGQVDTAKKLGESNHYRVQRRSASMSLSFGAAFICDQCDPFRHRNLCGLRRIVGLDAANFERYVGLEEGRSNATRPADAIVNPSDAVLVVAWRDHLLKTLLAKGSLALGIKIGRGRVLKTLLPEIAETNRFLLLTIGEIRAAMREPSESGVDNLGEFVCGQAAIEESVQSSDNRWRKTLRYLASDRLEEWLKNNLVRLRGSELDGEIVRAMIGYGASSVIVRNALRYRTSVIEPADVRSLIHKYAPAFAEPRKPSGGTPVGLCPETRERVQIAAAFSRCGWSIRKSAPFLSPGQPEGAVDNAYVFYSRYRTEIESAKAAMLQKQAEAIVQQITDRS
jgi:hypothetical protein